MKDRSWRIPSGGELVGLAPQTVLCPPRFLSRKDFVTFAIEDPYSDRLGWPLYICRGDDGGGRVRCLNLFFRQICRPAIDRPANKLDPEYPRLFRKDFGR
jgi:hypothetical protein